MLPLCKCCINPLTTMLPWTSVAARREISKDSTEYIQTLVRLGYSYVASLTPRSRIQARVRQSGGICTGVENRYEKIRNNGELLTQLGWVKDAVFEPSGSNSPHLELWRGGKVRATGLCSPVFYTVWLQCWVRGSCKPFPVNSLGPTHFTTVSSGPVLQVPSKKGTEIPIAAVVPWTG